MDDGARAAPDPLLTATPGRAAPDTWWRGSRVSVARAGLVVVLDRASAVGGAARNKYS